MDSTKYKKTNHSRAITKRNQKKKKSKTLNNTVSKTQANNLKPKKD
jgi:hypothetical protein